MNQKIIQQAYQAAVATYADYGVDVASVVEQMKKIEISVHCWQGDDVTGLETQGGGASGGILATGQYLGKPCSGVELRADIDQALKLMPGRKRLNLHTSYAELNGEKIDRDQYETRHFQHWIDWAKARDIALDSWLPTI